MNQNQETFSLFSCFLYFISFVYFLTCLDLRPAAGPTFARWRRDKPIPFLDRIFFLFLVDLLLLAVGCCCCFNIPSFAHWFLWVSSASSMVPGILFCGSSRALSVTPCAARWIGRQVKVAQLSEWNLPCSFLSGRGQIVATQMQDGQAFHFVTETRERERESKHHRTLD